MAAGLAVPAARPDRIGAPLDLRRRLDRPALGQAEQDRKLLRRRHAEVEHFAGAGVQVGRRRRSILDGHKAPQRLQPGTARPSRALHSAEVRPACGPTRCLTASSRRPWAAWTP